MKPFVSFWHIVRKLFDKIQQFPLPFVSSEPDTEGTAAVLGLDNDHLKSSGGLHHPFFADVDPFDILERNGPLCEPVPENNLGIGDNKFSVANPVQQQRAECDNDKERDDQNDRIVEYQRKIIFDKRTFDSDIENKRQKINQRLLIIKVQFVFEFMMHGSAYRFMAMSFFAISIPASGFPSAELCMLISARTESLCNTS